MGLFQQLRLSIYAAVIVLLLLGYYVYTYAHSAPLQNRDVRIEVPAGVGVAWLANELETKGVIENKWLFRFYCWMQGRDLPIKTGEYYLYDVQTIPEVLSKMVNGRVMQYSITLVEGHTFAQFLQKVRADERLIEEISDLSERQIMRYLGAIGRAGEGMFAPQTYVFRRGDSDLDVLKQAYQLQQKLLQDVWAERNTAIEVKTPYELLILASIVEKETGHAGERGLIAGVFNNRLRLGMKLQTDPTVIYGMGDQYKGNIRRKDLRTDTPYNTYTRFGLPPTPIALPGEAALLATAHPEATEALYFVARGDGSHQFSKTLEQHNKAVIKYQLGGVAKPFSSNEN